MTIGRSIEKRLGFVARHFPVVMVCGARQVGKTTILKEFSKNRNVQYVTLDYPAVRELARNDPELFLRRYGKPLIIDEIQYAPELLPYIKINSDESGAPGQYFLTGSQMFHSMKNVSESLAGRVAVLSLYSLSHSEIIARKSQPFSPDKIKEKRGMRPMDVFKAIYRGGMPKLVVDDKLTPEDYFGSYVQTYLERDIRDLINVKNESAFLKFLSCVAARTAQEINLTDMAKDVGVDKKTIENWISILVTSGIVFLLRPYSGNTIKRVVKRPKLYFMDSGLCCYLSLWNNPQTLEVSAMAGAMFETYAVSEIIKSYANEGIEVKNRLCYYRDNNGKEIDLMILQNGKIYPIEIKKNSNPGKEALKNFSILPSLNMEIGEGAVVCRSNTVLPLDGKNTTVPIEYI